MNTEQTIDRIIEQEIYTNASTMVTDLAGCADILPNTMDNLMDCMGTLDYSEPPENYSVRQDTAGNWCMFEPDATSHDDAQTFDTEDEAIRAAWDDCGDEPDMMEALQFWLVSDWLADKLEQTGAPVARDVLGFNVWGRTECGQPLTMDSALHAVAALIK